MIGPVKAIKLSWAQVSDCISEEVSKILGRRVVCDSRWNDYCYWATMIAGKRIPIEELYKIFDSLDANDYQRADSLPESVELTHTVGEIGMDASELLLERHFGYKWETTHIEEDFLWLLGEKDGDINEAKA